jgi:hypothetical protein
LAVVVGAEDALGRRLKHLGLTIEPFCSSLKPSGHRGTHCRGVVDATGSSVLWLVIPVDQSFGEGPLVGEGRGSNCVGP